MQLLLPLRRVKCLSEALRCRPRGEVEYFLWLLDVHDLDLDPLGRDALCSRLESMIVQRDLSARVPGKMPLYNHLILTFLVWMKMQDAPAPFDSTWAKENYLWVGDTTASDILIALDTLSLRWGSLEDSPSLQRYMRHLFRKGSWISYHLHGEEILNVPSMRYASGDKFRVHPHFICEMATRFQFFMREPTHLREEGGEKVLKWMKGKRNLRLSSFRAEVLKITWELALLPGDRIGGTTLNCLQKRHPPALLEMLRKKTMQGDPDEDAWAILMCKQTLSSYGIEWKNVFCSELWKHRRRLHRIPVPIMVRESMHFRVYYLGRAQSPYTNFARTFEIWLECVRDNGGKVYGKKLDSLIVEILNPPEKKSLGMQVPL